MCHQKILFSRHRFLGIPASSLLSAAANRKNQKCFNTAVRLLEAVKTLAKGRGPSYPYIFTVETEAEA